MRDRWSQLSRRSKVVVIGLGVFALLIIIGALSSPDDQVETTSETAQATTTSATESPPATVEAEPANTDCLQVGSALVRGLEEGLTTTGRGTLRFTRAVKSEAPDGYLISADIQAPGLDGSDDIATWSMTGSDLAVGGGLVFAVDSVAREFSDWGADINEPSQAADLRQAFRDSPAFEQSRDCVGS